MVGENANFPHPFGWISRGRCLFHCPPTIGYFRKFGLKCDTELCNRNVNWPNAGNRIASIGLCTIGIAAFCRITITSASTRSHYKYAEQLTIRVTLFTIVEIQVVYILIFFDSIRSIYGNQDSRYMAQCNLIPQREIGRKQTLY